MTQTVTVPVRLLPHAADLGLPAYATAEAAGLDLRAAIDQPIHLPPGARAPVPTGIALALEPGWEAQVRPRSGLALNHGVTVLNSPGTVDSDYRGEVTVIVINHGHVPVEIVRGMRVAQLVVAPVARVAWAPAEALAETGRGTGGFGSTGRS